MNELIEYFPAILEGSWVTLKVALMSVTLAVLFGLIGASSRLSASRWLRFPAVAYTTLIRGMPDLVLMLLVFYGGQVVLNDIADRYEVEPFDLDPFVAGVVTIGFIFGAYFTETFRGAFMAVPSGQMEAGRAYGMNRWQVFHRILFPQMIRHALPGIGNNWQVLLKSTAIVSMIGLTDMTLLADQAGRTTHQPFIFYSVVAVIYLLFTAISGWGMGRLEQRYSVGVRRATL